MMMDLFSNVEFNDSSEPKTMLYDLPDADITLFENFFTNQESKKLHQNLIENIQWRQDKIKIFGKLIDQPRLTAFYGDATKDYSYSGIVMKPNDWNDDLLFIKNRVEEIAKIKFTSVLLNYYRDGKDSMGWHSDDEKELGQNSVIGSVSFGESRVFQLRHKLRKDIKKVDIKLTDGSFLLMKGTTQHFWQHQIPKTTRHLEARINLTFRKLV
jgi:alkylated DNA repair dioxygenase AlkB